MLQPLDVVDLISQSLVVQGRRSSHITSATGPVESRYRYELDDGTVLRCAIGMLIPDDVYDESIEGAAVASLAINDGRWIAGGTSRCGTRALAEVLNRIPVLPHYLTYSVMCRMQEVHDFSEPRYWPQQFKCIRDQVTDYLTHMSLWT